MELPIRNTGLLLVLPAATAVFLSGCTSLFFFPTREYVATPEDLGLKFESVTIPVRWRGAAPDLKIIGWKIPAAISPACGTVVVFHGNAQNMSNHLFGVSWLPAAGFNLFIFDYRGYGESTGHPAVSSLVDDGELVLAEVIQSISNGPRGTPGKIVVYGQSIGAALAIPAVAQSKFRERIAAVILESSFYSYPGIVREKLGQFFLTWPLQYPLSWLFYSNFSPADFIGQLSPIPVLLVHGLSDQIVDSANSNKLYNQAKEPKQLWEFDSTGHISAFQNPVNREKLIQYLRNVFGCNLNGATTIK